MSTYPTNAETKLFQVRLILSSLAALDVYLILNLCYEGLSHFTSKRVRREKKISAMNFLPFQASDKGDGGNRAHLGLGLECVVELSFVARIRVSNLWFGNLFFCLPVLRVRLCEF